MPYSRLERMNIRSSLYSSYRVIIKVGCSLIRNNQIGHQRQVWAAQCTAQPSKQFLPPVKSKTTDSIKAAMMHNIMEESVPLETQHQSSVVGAMPWITTDTLPGRRMISLRYIR